MTKVLSALKRIAYDAKLFLPLLPRNPIEYCDRLAMSVANRREEFGPTPVYQTQQWGEMLRALGQHLNAPLAEMLNDPVLYEIEEVVRQRIVELPDDAPFSKKHNVDFTLARLSYLLCRILKPSIVLETGVAYGVSSAYILKALEMNDCGTLHSIDLPPSIRDDASRYVGFLIPEDLKHRWKIHPGMSKRILPALLPRLGRVGVFVHDSLHTYANMLWEFQTVTPYLEPDAALISDDIAGNTAFQEWVADANPGYWAAVQQVDKGGLFGVSVFSWSDTSE